MEFFSIDHLGRKWEIKQLCYIQEDNPNRIYLSMRACKQLGIIDNTFSSFGTSSVSSVESLSVHRKITCDCPKRSKPPPLPSIPYPAKEENRDKLEKWLINYYAASTFNVCEHQLLPLMPGPPLQLKIQSGAKPTATHIPGHGKEENRY